jgi:Flp pilus assembly protein CpaB
MGRRTLLLITSVLLAAVGTAIVALYVRQADHRAAQNEAVGTYVVARRPIEQGAKITSDDLATRRLRARDQLGSTVTDLDSVISRRARVDILADTPIDERQLTEAGADIDGGAIRNGEEGVDVQLSDPNRAVSLLGIGSSVRIFILTDEAEGATVLTQNARVIGIGGTVESTGAEGPDGKNQVGSDSAPAAVVALSVRPDIARKLVDAQLKGQPMYFTVLPSPEATDG